ncbi:anti-sigma factor family protein [Rosistilla oblonga]|uniref:anti-sigma factor family protein n=1 Tax=Rosistilla oblonga TaxID=2527990 RepID=UPI003A97BA46
MEATRPIDDGSHSDLDEQLVAYLDGELEDNQRAALEERLMEDPDCKQRLRTLQQTFDMLDELPRTTVNSDFARTTVEMIAINASQELEIVKQRRPWKLTAATVGLIFTTAITFLVGVVIVRGYQRQQQSELLEGLAVAEHLRAYSQIKGDADLKFFAELAEQPAWQEHVSISRDLEELPTRDVQSRLSAAAEAARTEQLAEMPADLKRDLQLQYEQLIAQPAARQAELKQYMQQIEARDDAERLTQTLVSYVDWLDTLSPPLQTKLQSASAAERLQLVAETIQETRKGGQEQLAAEDLDHLYQALFQIAQTRVADLPNFFSEEGLAGLQGRAKAISKQQGMSVDDVLGHMLVKTFVLPAMRNGPARDEGPSRMRPLTPREQQSIRKSLSPKATQSLQRLENIGEQQGQLFLWAMFATFKRSPIDGFGNNPLDTYESADAMLRERIDLSDPSEALKALRSRGGRGGMRPWDRRGPDRRGSDGRGPGFDSSGFEPGNRGGGPPRGENRSNDRRPPREGDPERSDPPRVDSVDE